MRSALWAEIIASALGRPLALIAASEHGGAIGVARLARLAATGETPDQVFRKPEKAQEVAPRPAWQSFYSERLAQYRQLTRALQPIR
jgi:xylulokinase